MKLDRKDKAIVLVLFSGISYCILYAYLAALLPVSMGWFALFGFFIGFIGTAYLVAYISLKIGWLTKIEYEKAKKLI
jgi:hypothetical protein